MPTSANKSDMLPKKNMTISLSDRGTLSLIMDSPGDSHPEFKWNVKAQRYQYIKGGQFVPKEAFKALTEKHIATKKSQLRAIGEKFADKGGFVAFQKDGWENIKTTFAQQYALGRGGIGRMGDEDKARLEEELVYQRKMWKGFAKDIKAGTVSPAQMQARLAMYGEASKVAFCDGREAAAIAAGMTEELNVMNAEVENCEGCQSRTKEGWKPIGSLGRITKDTECRIFCHCTRSYRKGPLRKDAIRMDKPCGKGFIKNEFNCSKNPSAAPHKELIEIGKKLTGSVMEGPRKALQSVRDILDRIKEGDGDLEELRQQLSKEKEALNASLEGVKEFRQSLINNSPVTNDDIDAFFEELGTTKRARASIEKGELKGDEFSRVFEEFYLISKGQIKPGVIVDSQQFTLASAAINLSTRRLYIDEESNREDIFHELGHLLEHDNPKIAESAYSFLLERANSDKVPLSKLTGIKGHNKIKVYPDKFVDPYVGRVYTGSRDTEIISVGLQHFTKPLNMVYLYLKDSDHFYLSLGALNASLSNKK